MMDAPLDPTIEETTYKTSSRVGKTECLNNIIGYHIDVDPCPIMMVQPNIDDGQKWSIDQFSTMVRDTPALVGKVVDRKSRDKNATILHKTFLGGYLTIVGANAPSGLARSAIRLLLLDEVDRYPASAGVEGDPVKLAEKRTITFWNRKIIRTSTPTVEGVSRIDKSWEASDQRFYFVPCPICKHDQILIFGPRSKYAHMSKGMLKYDEKNLSWIYYECGNCKKPIKETYKLSMIRSGFWQQTKPQVRGHAGFHINELYSPFSSWDRIVKDWLESNKYRDTLKVFINTTLGESFSERESYQFDVKGLKDRREKYDKIPAHAGIAGDDALRPGPIILTCGVDVQNDRLEAFVYGWGLKEESWFIEHRIIHGSPAKEITWDALDDFLFKTIWEHEDGFKAKYGEVGGLIAVGIDTGGHHTKTVYEYIKRRKGMRVFALKGMGGFGKEFLKMSRSRKVAVPLVIMGADAGKQLIYERLGLDKPGPGYIHFNFRCDDDYFSQLTAETPSVQRPRGYPTIVWNLPSGRRNEALDGTNYALAAYTIIRPDMESLAETLKEKKEKYKPQQGPPQEPERQQQLPMRRRKSWLDRWK